MQGKQHPSDFFVFEEVLDKDRGLTRTVAFVGGASYEPAELTERLRDHHLGRTVPAEVLVVGSGGRREAMLALAGSTLVRDALPGLTRYLDTPPLRIALFDRGGKLKAGLPTKALTDESPAVAERTLRQGLHTIFRERHGLLEAGPGFHYVNPSGRHTVAFIRAGNVLLHSAEIAFLGWGLLGWFPMNVKRIFTDTASINSVAYALTDLARDFEDEYAAPTIDSFSSYGGLGDFDFDYQDAFCLISASTSGGLSRRFVEKGLLTRDRIVTLFYCGDPPERDLILTQVDYTDAAGGPARIESYDSYDECAFCRDGSATIHISGDQFLPADPEVEDLVVSQDHEPAWLANFLDQVLGQRAVRCHGDHTGSADSLREIYLHLPSALREPETGLGKTVRDRLLSAVPASLDRIIHLSDPSSLELASVIADHYARIVGGDSSALLMSESDLRDQAPDLGLSHKTVLVAAGAVATGRSLLAVSQALRSVNNVGHIAYVVGIARLESQAQWMRLRSNLTFGREPNEYPMMVATRATLPISASSTGSPWAVELRELIEQRDSDAPGGVSAEAAELFNARIDFLDRAVHIEDPGLVDDLFLPAITHGVLSLDNPARLKLRDGFVFWRRVNRDIHPSPEANATQAEVYLTVASVLHELRQPRSSGRALIQHAHNRTVLSPANFARFNDGVIQAAFLRAARPSELDYSHSARLSGEMLTMLIRFSQQRESREGEAFPEFLYALSRRKLRLSPSHARELTQSFATLPLPPMLAEFASAFERATAASPA